MKDIYCVMCGEDFTEGDLDDFRDLGEQYHWEKGCFLCPDCWDEFKRLTLEEQTEILLS